MLRKTRTWHSRTEAMVERRQQMRRRNCIMDLVCSRRDTKPWPGFYSRTFTPHHWLFPLSLSPSFLVFVFISLDTPSLVVFLFLSSLFYPTRFLVTPFFARYFSSLSVRPFLSSLAAILGSLFCDVFVIFIPARKCEFNFASRIIEVR